MTLQASSQRFHYQQGGLPSIYNHIKCDADKLLQQKRIRNTMRRPLKIGGRQNDFHPGSYANPQQVSKVNSLWSTEQCRYGNLAKLIRNFGTGIDSVERSFQVTARGGFSGGVRTGRRAIVFQAGVSSARGFCRLSSPGAAAASFSITHGTELVRTPGARLSN